MLINRDLAAGNAGNQVEDLPQGDARASTNIVDAPGHATDGGIGGRRGGIRHIREIAGLEAVAELDQGPAVEDGREKPVKAHVGALTRAVNGEVAQRYRRHAEVHVIQVAELLGREFRHAVRRHRLRQCGLDHRDHGVIAVHGRARRVDEAFDRPLRAGLEQPLRSVDVEAGVNTKLRAPAAAHPGLRGEMKHVGNAVERLREIELAQIAFDEFVSVAATHAFEVALLQRPRIEIRERVDGAHARAAFEQQLAEVGADESRATRDQRFHANKSFTRSGIRTGRPWRSMVACTVWPVASVAPSARRIAS